MALNFSMLKNTFTSVLMNTRFAKYLRPETKFKHFEIREIRPITMAKEKRKPQKVRYNLVISGLSADSIYAGVKTSFDFILNFPKVGKVDLRLVVAGERFDKNYLDTLKGFQEIVNLTGNERSLPVHEKDVFIAHSWHTAYIVADLLKEMKERKIQENPKLIYMIQDYEAGFYPWSGKSLLAEGIYSLDSYMIGIFNSESLRTFVLDKEFHFYKEYTYIPRLNKQLKKYLLDWNQTYHRKKQIFLYGRYNSRNAFDLIVMGLKEWFSKDEKASEWTIVSAGMDLGELKGPNGLVIHTLGKLSMKSYAQTMLESKIGISLMVSPHPSYPPLEMSTFGMKVITNSYGTKNLNGFNPNIISLDLCTPHTIADTLVKLTGVEDLKNEPCLESDYLLDDTDQWNDICRGIHEDLKEQWNEN